MEKQAFTVKPVETLIEEQITTAMIISTDFLKDINPVFQKDYIKNSFAKIICYWCYDYYQEYQQAPGKAIRSIYVTEVGESLKEEDSEIIGEFLDRLSKQYSEDSGINEAYIKDKAIEYFQKRNLELRVEKAQHYIAIGNIEKAEEQFADYKKTALSLSNWFNPFDSKEIIEVFDEKDDGIFSLPGDLGKIVGKLERGWFVAILGVFKEGKSFFLDEMIVRALTQRLKVASISLEMKKKNRKERLYRRLTALGSRTGDDVFLYPIFDCVFNQNGDCDMPERTNDLSLLDSEGKKPEFDVTSNYKPCTYCRDNMLRGYSLATWYETIELPPFTFTTVKKDITAFERMFGKNLRMITYPRFSADLKDIKRDLYLLEQDGFIPDIIVIDYADIIKHKGERQDIDNIWKDLSALAGEKHCIVFTASQGNRGALHKEDKTQDDLAEWIGKLAHVDVFLSLNQTKQEKREKVIRVGVMAHRHKEVDDKMYALLLQQLEIGQFLLDNQSIRKGN